MSTNNFNTEVKFMNDKLIDEILEKTQSTLTKWENHCGYAPAEASENLNKFQSDRIIGLTKTLHIWMNNLNEDKYYEIGADIMAYTNLGALVESWLVFFLSVYTCDYNTDPKCDKNRLPKEIDTLGFDELLKYCKDILLPERGTYQFVAEIKGARNTIHAYKQRYIRKTFEKDLQRYSNFLDTVFNRLPDFPND